MTAARNIEGHEAHEDHTFKRVFGGIDFVNALVRRTEGICGSSVGPKK